MYVIVQVFFLSRFIKLQGKCRHQFLLHYNIRKVMSHYKMVGTFCLKYQNDEINARNMAIADLCI